MNFLSIPMGAIETMMIDLGDVEMGKFLNLPTHAYLGLSDAKIPDAQAGIEAIFGAVLAGMAGVNMISGLGMLDYESCQSIENLIIGNEIAGMVKRLVLGIEDYGLPYAQGILKDYDEKQELLSHPSTLKLFKKELFFPGSSITRKIRDEWKSKGSTSARQRTKELIPKLIEKSPKNPLNNELGKELDKITQENL